MYVNNLCFSSQISAIFVPYGVNAGASGAVFGLLGVLFVELGHFWQIIDHPFLELLKLTAFVVFLLALGTLPYVDNMAHIGMGMGLCSVVLYIEVRKHIMIVCTCINKHIHTNVKMCAQTRIHKHPHPHTHTHPHPHTHTHTTLTHPHTHTPTHPHHTHTPTYIHTHTHTHRWSSIWNTFCPCLCPVYHFWKVGCCSKEDLADNLHTSPHSFVFGWFSYLLPHSRPDLLFLLSLH